MEFAQRGFESYGIELNPILVWWSRLRLAKSGLKNTKIIFGNFWKLNLSNFDIMYLFHFKKANQFLEEKLDKELMAGSIIISVSFPLTKFTLIQKEGPFLIYQK